MSTEEGKERPNAVGLNTHVAAANLGPLTKFGEGGIGGKAQGLAEMAEILGGLFDAGSFPAFTVDIPGFAVISTDVFDCFMEGNRLYDLALSDARDSYIANAFQKARLPLELLALLAQLLHFSAAHPAARLDQPGRPGQLTGGDFPVPPQAAKLLEPPPTARYSRDLNPPPM